MKLARIKHNKQYDMQPTFHLPMTKKVMKKKKVTNKELNSPKTPQPKKKKRKTTKRIPAKTPDKRALRTRADVQMTPVQSPNDIAGDVEDQTLSELVSELAIASEPLLFGL